MSRFKFNISVEQFKELKLKYPEYSLVLEELVEYLGPKAVIDMETLPGDLPVALTNELWRIALRWVNRKAFSSYFLQIHEIVKLPFTKSRKVLEIGPGPGVLRALMSILPHTVVSVDIDINSRPDIVCDITRHAIREKSFDTVVAFQVLEHIPYKHFQNTIKTLSRIARNYVLISIPFNNHYLAVRIESSLVRHVVKRAEDGISFSLCVNRSLDDIDEQSMLKRTDKHNPHYWEAGRRSYPIRRILRDIESMGLNVLRSFYNFDYPYHYFILLSVA